MKRDWLLWITVAILAVAMGLGPLTRLIVGTAWGLGDQANGTHARILGVVEKGSFTPLPWGYSPKTGTMRIVALREGTTPDSPRPNLDAYEGALVIVEGERNEGWLYRSRITRSISQPVWVTYLRWAWRN